jgi:hypothetical protein
MSESQSPDHWSQLVSEIGAEPVEPPSRPEPDTGIPPEEPAAESPPPSAEFPPRSIPPVSSEPPSSPQVGPAPDWDALARELGIEVPPAPPATPPEAVDSGEEKLPGEAPGEEKPAETAAYLSRSEAEAILFGGGGSSPPPGMKQSAPSGEHKRHRRHKRRKNDRDREHTAEREEQQPASARESAEDESEVGTDLTWEKIRDFEEENIMAGRDTAVSSPEKDSEEVAVDDQAEPSSRRRGRRAGRKKKRKHKIAGGPSEPELDEAVAADSGSEKSGAGPADEEPFAADQDEEEKSSLGHKSGFRSIPTWSEAIGVIIAKNIESHGKRFPEGGGSSRSSPGPREKRR